MRTVMMMALLAIAGCDPPPGSSAGPGPSGNGTNGANGGGGGFVQTCSPSSTGSLFGNALCLCGSLHDIGNLVVHKSQPGASASVGVDGVARMINHSEIGDSFAAWGGLDDIGYTAVHHDIISSSNVAVAGDLDVDHDLSVGGNLSGLGRVAVGGTLRVAGADEMLGWQQASSRGSYSPLPAAPCPCDAASLFDVAGAVAAAKPSATVLSSQPTGSIGVEVVTLGSGAYYSADAATIGLEKLHITGAVSLFVDGTLDEIGADRISIDPGATLDLYVSAGVNTIGFAGLGDATSPASFRLYVGGAAPVTLNVGAQWFHGSIYAPKANLIYVGDTNVAGGLFANELVGTGQLVIGGALPGTMSGGGSCPPVVPDTPNVTATPPVW
jgi:hypothetical protein